MKNNYIPEIIKEKISFMINFFYGLFLLLVSMFSALALVTFNINDNSFLTRTSNSSENLFGDLGSYYASFLFYTFGILAYLIVIFFLVYSILVFVNRKPKYLFIRLLFFFISLILIPQILINLGINIKLIDSIDTWGVFSIELYSLYSVNYISYLLTFFGLLIFFYSQNIIILQ